MSRSQNANIEYLDPNTLSDARNEN